MAIFELHIAGEIVRDEDINSLYKAIMFTEVSWEMYMYRDSKVNDIIETIEFEDDSKIE